MSIFDLQAAVHGVLDGDATLMAIVDAIYVDMAPKGAVFPYVIIRSMGGGAGYKERLAVDVFEKDESLAVIRGAAERSETLLDGCRHDLGGDYDYAGVFLGVSNVKDKALALCRYASVGGIYGYNLMPFDGIQRLISDVGTINLNTSVTSVLIKYEQNVTISNGIAKDSGVMWLADGQYAVFRRAITEISRSPRIELTGQSMLWRAQIAKGEITKMVGRLVEFNIYRDDYWGSAIAIVLDEDIKNADDAIRENYVDMACSHAHGDMPPRTYLTIEDTDGGIEKLYICAENERTGTSAYIDMALSTVFSGTTKQTFNTLSLNLSNYDMGWARVLVKAGTISSGVLMSFELKNGSDVLWEGEEIELGTDKIHDLGVMPLVIDDNYLSGTLSLVLYVRLPAGGSYTVTSSAAQVSAIDAGFLVIDLVNTMANGDKIILDHEPASDEVYLEQSSGNVPITPRGRMKIWEGTGDIVRVRFWADSVNGVDQDMTIEYTTWYRRLYI